MLYLRKLFICLFLLLSSNIVFAQNTPNTKSVSSEKQLQQVININQADLATLLRLKGVGKVKAQAILDYRQQHGNFTSLEQLLQVKGIGQKFLNDNLTYLTI